MALPANVVPASSHWLPHSAPRTPWLLNNQAGYAFVFGSYVVNQSDLPPLGWLTSRLRRKRSLRNLVVLSLSVRFPAFGVHFAGLSVASVCQTPTKGFSAFMPSGRSRSCADVAARRTSEI